jgi:hypothetical protein
MKGDRDSESRIAHLGELFHNGSSEIVLICQKVLSLFNCVDGFRLQSRRTITRVRSHDLEAKLSMERLIEIEAENCRPLKFLNETQKNRVTFGFILFFTLCRH